MIDGQKYSVQERKPFKLVPILFKDYKVHCINEKGFNLWASFQPKV